MDAALRAGHGSGAEFELRIDSGADPVLRLSALDVPSVRWVDRILLDAYAPHQWHPLREAADAGSSSQIWEGGRVHPWPVPLRLPGDGAPSVDLIALAFRSLPVGVRCGWRFRPAQLTRPAWWEVQGSRSDARFGYATLGSTPRTRRPETPEVEPERPPFWWAQVRIESDRAERGASLVRCAAGAVESATRTSRGNGLWFRPRRWWTGAGGARFALSDLELGAVLPGPTCPATGRALERGVPPVLPLGRSRRGAVVGPEIEPEQGRHLAVLGETGMGKSSLLLSIARRVAEGSGLVLLDPLGDTVRALRDELSPARPRRLTWIDSASPLGLNALEGVGGDSLHSEAHRERQLSALVQSLRRVRSGRYVDSGFWGPRLEEMLTRALRAAASFPGGTLVDAHALLASGARGFRAVPPESTEAVRELSDRIRSRPDDAEGARRLLYEIVRSPILVRSLCDRNPSLRVADLVAPGRLVLIAGDAASVGEPTARYLLSVYLALLWSELLSRPHAGKTFVVLDEAQWFVHESLAEMLRLGRRRNVHVVLATQSIASLPEPVAEAVWTNVSDFVAFRGSPDEAREFSRAARGISPEAVLSLPRGEAAVLLGKGNAVHWIRTARLPVADSAPDSDPPATAAGDLAGSGATDIARTTADRVRPTVRDPPDPRRAVLAAILRKVGRSPADFPVRISLAELRREADPDGRGVRAAGGLLGRSGAIVRTGRDESGPCWWVDPRQIASLDPVDPPATGTADSDLSQHS